MIKSFEQFIKESENLFVPRNLEDREDKLLKLFLDEIDKTNGLNEDFFILNGFKFPENYKFPKNLIINGNLHLANCENLDDQLSDNLSARTLDVSYSNIKKLPSNVNVRYLIATDCKNLKELPADLNVLRDVYLKRTAITEIPKTVKIGGKIYW